MRKTVFSLLLALFLVASLVAAEEVIDVYLVADDGNFDGNVLLIDDEPSTYSGSSGNYELKILDSNSNVLWSQNFELSYMYNQSLDDFPFDMLGYKILYDVNMFELKLYKDGSNVFSKQLSFCNNNGVCDYSSETRYSCPNDCNEPIPNSSSGGSGVAYRKARWSWQASFDYFVNLQYSDDKVNWHNILPYCTHVRFREDMEQQKQVWSDVGAHKYWALYVCGIGGTPPFRIWEMDWFTHDGTNYVENNPTADEISFEGQYTYFNAANLVDNNLGTLGLQRNQPGTSTARMIITKEVITPVSLSAKWKDELDSMVVPSDKVNLRFTLKNEMAETMHNVVLNFQNNEDYLNLEQSSISLGDVLPGQEKNFENAMLIAGVDNSEIYTKIIQNNQQISLDDVIKVTIGYGTESVTQDVTPTDETLNTLKIQYPDLTSIVGNDPTATPEEQQFYMIGDDDWYNPSYELVRKYAIEAGRYEENNPNSYFPDNPATITPHIYRYVDDILENDDDEGNAQNDIWISDKLESDTLQYYSPWICIPHAYLLTSFARMLGIPSKEVNIAIGVPFLSINLITKYWQEAATQVWYDGDWHFFDSWYATKEVDIINLNDYLTKSTDLIAYKAWYAFDRQSTPIWSGSNYKGHDFWIWPWGALRSDSQWKFLQQNNLKGLTIIAHSPISMYIVDEQGRIVGNTPDGVVREIPNAKYVPPNTTVPSLAGDTDSFFELDEFILIPDEASLGENFTLNVKGTDTGSYTIAFARFEGIEGDYTNVTTFTSSIGRNETQQYEVSISETGTVEIILDSDHDGVLDKNDLCLNTVLPEELPAVKLNPEHFADVDVDGYFETIDSKTKSLVEDVLPFSATYGCSCKQILDIKPGKDEGELKHGCTKGTMETFMNKQGWAKSFFM